MSQVRRRNKKQDTKSDAPENDESVENDVEYAGDGKSFSLLDYVRIIGGLLMINFVLSYYITGTVLWGQKTRWTNPRYVKFMVTGPHYLSLSEQELALYNGSDPELPVYVALDGKVYDVTSNRLTYGPGGPYSFFSGRDAARAYVTGCFQTDLTHDLRGLDQEEAQASLKGWQNFYENSYKYWLVGRVNHDPLTGDPPPPCNADRAPAGVGS